MNKTELDAASRDAYETYLFQLINTPKDKQALVKALDKMTPGSHLHDFMQILVTQHLSNGQITKEQRDEIEKFIDKRTGFSTETRVRQYLHDLDNIKDNKEHEKKLMDFINSELRIYNGNHSKPYHQEHQAAARKGKDDAEDRSLAK